MSILQTSLLPTHAAVSIPTGLWATKEQILVAAAAEAAAAAAAAVAAATAAAVRVATTAEEPLTK